MTSANTIDNQILNYLGYLSENKKKAILNLVKTFANEPEMLWNFIPNDIQKGIIRGLSQSKRNIGKPHEEVMMKYKKWLKK